MAKAAGTSICTLAVSAPAHRPTAVPAQVGGERPRQDVELPAGTRLSGTVRADGHGPPADAQVTRADAARNVVRRRADRPGREYSFADLTGGRYALTASAYAPVTSSVNLDGEGEDTHDVWLGSPA